MQFPTVTEWIMKLLEMLLKLFAIPMEKPEPYGDYHVLCLLVFGIISLLLCFFFKNAKDKTYRSVMLLFWISMLIFEAYKETVISHRIIDGEVVFSYPWSAFPFQLCSTPLYVLPFLALLPDCRLRDFFAAYTATFALIGGLGVFFFPRTVFSTSLLGNIHSMNHHGIQVATGLFTAAWYRERMNFRFYLKSETLFILMFSVAMWLNTDFYDYLKTLNKHHGFNMFFINPSVGFNIQVFEELLNKIPRETIHAYYFVGISILAGIMVFAFGIGSRVKRRGKAYLYENADSLWLNVPYRA